MRIICISDTHLRHLKFPINVPIGDLLVHAGDATFEGSPREIQAFFDWFSALPHKHKVFVAGNHDWLFQKNPELARQLVPKNVTYLQDSMAEIEGLKVYGAPWQPEFMNWAFNLPRGHRLREKWNLIPSRVDVLITHGPPLRYCDLNPDGEHVGCGDLHDVIVKRVKPRLHVFGHIHGGYGIAAAGRTLFVNASVCDEAYRPSHAPIIVELDPSAPAKLPEVVQSMQPFLQNAPPIIGKARPLW